MPPLALEGLRVLDISTNVAGSYCTRLLADLGAEVIIGEPPAGHPLRHLPPTAAAADRAGALFAYLGGNKERTSVALATEAGRARFRELAAGADLVVESGKPGELAALGLAFDNLARANPALTLTSITHFGQYGPYAQWESEEIVDWALGGYLFFGGDAAREPLMVPYNQSMFHAGAQAAVASLAALRWAAITGRGQHVDVSAVEALLSAHIWTLGNWTHQGIVERRKKAEPLRCADGWVRFMTPRFDPALFTLVERPELAGDPRFATREGWKEHEDFLAQLVAGWLLVHTKEEVFAQAQELRIPATPVYDAADLLRSPVIQARDWWTEGEGDDGKPMTFPGFPYKLSRSPASVRRPAPSLEVQTAGWPERGPRPRPAAPDGYAGAKLPLTGVRVVEITGNWAGPYAGRLLGDLGADVIKVENPNRPLGRTVIYPGKQPLKHHYNRSPYFNKLHRNKRSLTLDVAAPEGRAVFLDLIREADVFIENNSPRVMTNLDLEYETLREVNPRLIMAAISAFGHTGPARDYVAYGANIEASCGLSAVMGYRDEARPYHTGMFYADPITAAHTAAAVLAALEHRDRTGEGQYIDLSLEENGIIFFAEPLIEYQATGLLPERRGNRHRRFAPQGCYPTMGDDSWVVLCVRSNEEWARLAALIGDPALADPALGSVEERRARHDAIDEAIAAWTSGFDHHEAAGLLQRHGIAAAPVLENWELVSNLHFHARGFYERVPHAEMGLWPTPGAPWKLSETPARIRMPSPLYGEHNAEILRGLLGLSEERIAELYEKGLVAGTPPPTIPAPVVLYAD